jgi:hypothetical protein
MQVEIPYLWERHATIKGFFRLLLQGNAAGEASIAVTTLTYLFAAFIAAGLIAIVIRRTGRRDYLIAATIAATPLLMPFYFDYDLLLLSIPATLFASEFLSEERAGQVQRLSDRLAWTWVALYAMLLVNPAVGSLTRINFAVPLLFATASMLIWRAWRYNSDATALSEPPAELRQAA